MSARRLAMIALGLLAVCAAASEVDTSGVIQTVELNPAHAYFVPTHPRVTTTIRFPQEIGAPDGSVSVFTEDAAKAAGEYLVMWQQGESYFTLTPLKVAPMANLNVPYRGQTYVFYFYPVEDQLKAVACVNLTLGANSYTEPETNSARAPLPPPVSVTRQAGPPADTFVPATAARLLGLLDRLKLVHATPIGPALAQLSGAMSVDIAVPHAELVRSGQDHPAVGTNGIAAEIAGTLSDAGLYQILLLRAVRDNRINCIGFICLIRNVSNQTITFDVKSFSARAGAEYLSQRISDAPPVLKPGEAAPAYFVVQPPRHAPLLAGNEWKICVDLVSPRLNPGAAITSRFGDNATP